MNSNKIENYHFDEFYRYFYINFEVKHRMSNSEDFTKIKEDISRIIANMGGSIRDYHAFIYWFINNLYGNDQETISKSICDGTNDKGIDACLINDLERTVTLIQSKYSKDGDARIQSESEVKLFSAIDSYFSSPDSFEAAITSGNLRTKELLRNAFHKYYHQGYTVESIFITTHKRNNRIDEMLHTTLKQSYIRKLRIFYFDNIIAFYRDSERNFLPFSPPYDLKYKTEGSLYKNGRTRAWVFNVDAEELKSFALHYDRNILFRKNVRNFLDKSETNIRITDTLKNPDDSSNFWFYNNGVTILCRDAKNDSDNKHIRLDDPQVINGCQTITSIRNYSGDTKADALVRVIASDDNDLMDKIVFYQNSSNPVKKRDLKANDPVQIRLHREMLKRGWYYEIKSGEDFRRASSLSASIKSHCFPDPINNLALARAIVAIKFNPAIAYGQGENYFFGEMYEDIFTGELSATSSLAMYEIDFLVSFNISWTKAQFHAEFDKEYKFKRPAHFVIDKIFYNALLGLKDGEKKFTELFEESYVNSEDYDKLVNRLTGVADTLYEIIYRTYKKALANEGKIHTTFFKNQEDITNLFEENTKEFVEQGKLASDIFGESLS